MSSGRWVIGDLHGCYDNAVRILREAGLIDENLGWSGGDAQLFFIGDLTDRGPQGLACIDLVMRLQAEASDTGGRVESLMGNHEIFLLGAKLHPNGSLGPADFTLDILWRSNGGKQEDIDGLTDTHVAWLLERPAVVTTGNALLIHADSEMYAELGSNPDETNRHVTRVLGSTTTDDWDQLIHAFVRRNELWDEIDLGELAIRRLLGTFGASRVIHGHTPIPLLTQRAASGVTEPLVYSGGRCMNVDGGMFLGGPGFAVSLDK